VSVLCKMTRSLALLQRQSLKPRSAQMSGFVDIRAIMHSPVANC